MADRKPIRWAVPLGCESLMGIAAYYLTHEENMRQSFSQPSRYAKRLMPDGTSIEYIMNDVVDCIRITPPQIIRVIEGKKMVWEKLPPLEAGTANIDFSEMTEDPDVSGGYYCTVSVVNGTNERGNSLSATFSVKAGLDEAGDEYPGWSIEQGVRQLDGTYKVDGKSATLLLGADVEGNCNIIAEDGRDSIAKRVSIVTKSSGIYIDILDGYLKYDTNLAYESFLPSVSAFHDTVGAYYSAAKYVQYVQYDVNTYFWTCLNFVNNNFCRSGIDASHCVVFYDSYETCSLTPEEEDDFASGTQWTIKQYVDVNGTDILLGTLTTYHYAYNGGIHLYEVEGEFILPRQAAIFVIDGVNKYSYVYDKFNVDSISQTGGYDISFLSVTRHFQIDSASLTIIPITQGEFSLAPSWGWWGDLLWRRFSTITPPIFKIQGYDFDSWPDFFDFAFLK